MTFKAKHLATWADDESAVTLSTYETPTQDDVTFFLKVGAFVIEIKSYQMEAIVGLLKATMEELPEETCHLEI